MTTTSDTRRTRGVALLIPALLAPVCLLAAAPLLRGDGDFWGFLLSLIGGWLAAVAAVGVLLAVRPLALSMVLHVALGVALALLLWVLTQTAGTDALPPAVRTVVGLAAAPAAGWVWLTLLGRITGSPGRRSARRAATLVPVEWQQDARGWSLRLRVSPMRRHAFVTTIVIAWLIATAALSTFIVVFSDLAQRMSPMVMLFLLGWIVGMPGYLIVRGIVRARTVAVELRIDDRSLRVRRTDDEVALFDAPLTGVRRLRWASDSPPTRIELTPVDGEPIVLLVGMARRPRDASPTLPPLPPHLRRTLDRAGLPEKTRRRPRTGELLLERP